MWRRAFRWYRCDLSAGRADGGAAWLTYGRGGQEDGLANGHYQPLRVERYLPGKGQKSGASRLRARMSLFRTSLRIPVKVISDSGLNVISDSGQSDHRSERSDAGVGL